MGNDGGSIPTRRELVKEAARNPSTTQLKETRNENQQYHWTTCPLSNQPLREPIVSDSAGQLYSKDAVLEYLLEAGTGATEGDEVATGKGFKARVQGIRDIVEVKFQAENTTGSNQPALSGLLGPLTWVCPITKKKLGPGVKAVYLVPCGHAFLASVVKEMPGENCLQCNEPYVPDNVIPILPFSSTETERLSDRVERLKKQGLTHSLKKASSGGKKRKRHVIKAESLSLDEVQADSKTTAQVMSTTKALQGSIKNEGTASLTAKVLAEEKDRSKRRKNGTNDNLRSLFSSKNGMAEKHVDFMTRGFSIPAGAKR